MAALTDLSDVVNRVTGGNSGTPEALWFFRDPRVGGAAASATITGRMQSLWQYSQTPNGPGTAPTGTARNPTNATAGALAQADPGGGRQKWPLSVIAVSNATGIPIIYDRLADFGGLSGTSTSAQNTTSLAVTRYTGTAAVGNHIAIEISTIIGTTGTTVTASYTNQAGTSGRTTTAAVIGGTGFREAQRFISLPLQSGDTGARSVQSITLAGTTGTVGDIAVVIWRPLIEIPLQAAGIAGMRSFITGQGGAEIVAGACLAMTWVAGSTTAPQIFGMLLSIEK